MTIDHQQIYYAGQITTAFNHPNRFNIDTARLLSVIFVAVVNALQTILVNSPVKLQAKYGFDILQKLFFEIDELVNAYKPCFVNPELHNYTYGFTFYGKDGSDFSHQLNSILITSDVVTLTIMFEYDAENKDKGVIQPIYSVLISNKSEGYSNTIKLLNYPK
jgi:hypothetical protein